MSSSHPPHAPPISFTNGVTLSSADAAKLRSADYILDTNVVADLMTLKGLDDATLSADKAKLLYRRERARDALWLMMALDEKGATTISAEEETKRVIPFLAPVTTAPFWPYMLSRMLYLTAVCSGWRMEWVPSDVGVQGTRVDLLLVDMAVASGNKPLITQEAKLLQTRCPAAGIQGLTPSQLAGTVLPLKEARMRFMERYDRDKLELAVGIVHARWPDSTRSAESLEQIVCEWIRDARDAFAWIWRCP